MAGGFRYTGLMYRQRQVLTAVVSGANRGLGLEFCNALHARGDNVVALCRHTSDELGALDIRVEAGIDVSQDSVEQEVQARLHGLKVDLLIHNAGILRTDTLDTLDFNELRLQFEINALGPLRLTRGMLPHLVQGAKIGIVTSRMGSITDNSSGGYYGYRMSKAAVNMAGVSLACDLKNRAVAVALLHPGFVRTDMTEYQGNIDPPAAVEGMLARLDALRLETSGGFWHSNGESLPW